MLTDKDWDEMPTVDGLDEIDDILDQAEVSDLIADGEKLSMPETREVPCQFITGPAGTGKTTLVMERTRQDPRYGTVCATTGVAAVNLGSITINSLLKYFNTESLKDAYLSGTLTTALAALAHECRNLIIDEVSMMDAEQLDYIYMAATQVAERKTVKHPLGIIVVGDFCQLPPVKAKWAFEADCWPRFEANTTRLETFYRQTDPAFLKALAMARRGDPYSAAALQKAGVEFTGQRGGLDDNFQGTTILPTNVQVDRFNRLALTKVKGRDVSVRSERWGEQRSEWDHIPKVDLFKVGALIMILANDTPAFSYVNGDLGYIEDVQSPFFFVKLIRTGEVVQIGPIERFSIQREAPSGYSTPTTFEGIFNLERENKPQGLPYFSLGMKRWVTGGVKYYPIRLGYAITVHKSQGLTLDRVQIDVRNYFFGQPNMAYVALSRARTPQGLRIVGALDRLASRIQVAPEVTRWL